MYDSYTFMSICRYFRNELICIITSKANIATVLSSGNDTMTRNDIPTHSVLTFPQFNISYFHHLHPQRGGSGLVVIAAKSENLLHVFDIHKCLL
jgi:hypothetical protein